MGKLEQYAKKLEAKKAKARAYIEKMETLGFTVSESLKKTAYSATPEKVPLKTLKQQPNLDLRRIAGEVKKQIPSHSVNITLHNPINGNAIDEGRYNIRITPKTKPSVVEDLNENLHKLKSYYPAEQIKKNIRNMIYRDFRSFNPGKELETKDYKITPGWDDDTLLSHITFKPGVDLNSRYIKDILNVPQATTRGNELYKEDWHHRSFVQGVDNILNRQGGSLLSGLTRSKIDTLEYIMNTSEAWNIVKKGFSYKDGKNKGAVQDRWIKLYKAVSDIEDNDDDAFNKVKTMIDNEEDLDKILKYVNDTIAAMQKKEEEE